MPGNEEGEAGAAVSFWITPGGKIATWNDACSTLLGYAACDILSRPFSRLLSQGAAVQLPALLEAAQKQPATVETEFLHAGGTPVPVTLTLAPQCRKGGRLCAFGVLVRAGAVHGPPAPPLSEHDLLARTPLGEMINLLPGTFYIINSSGRLVLWNTWVEKATQLTTAEIETMPATHMFPEGERELVQSSIEEVMHSDTPVVVEANLLSRDGSATPFLFTGARFIANGMPYLCGMGLDISERRQQEEQLRLRERALHASSNGILIARSSGPSHAIGYVNPAFERMTGYRASEIVGANWENVCAMMSIPGLDDDQHAQVRAAIRERRETRVTCRHLRKNGEVFWNEMTVAPVLDDPGGGHFIGVMNDVTESKQRTSYLEHEINHDMLTGLANRNLLWDRLEQAIHMAQRSKALVATILVDLDNFKIINDTLGHDAGDEVLRVVARKMLGSVRESDTVARLGGDEFVLVLVNQPSLRYTLRMIERLRRGMENAVTIDGREVPVLASMGVSVFPHDGANAGELIRAADTAMYHAKLAGRNDVQFFSHDMKVATDAKQKLEMNMRHALDNGEMFLLYQPKLSLATGRIVGAEALLRWRHPEQGVLLPASFILEAEENGAILLFGDWVFNRLCEVMQRFKTIGYDGLVMSMNVSFREFSQRDFIGLLGEKLLKSELAPESFELEISEANLLRNADLSRRIFNDIARLGIKLTVDEFGAGVSSLKNLHELPVTSLKIFKSYVARLTIDNVSDMMAKTIIGIGHLMNMGVIGEGVETPGQRDFLKQNGCDQAQGNYFSQPLALPDFERLLAATNFATG